MACLMAAATMGGFALNLVTGRTSFAMPLLVHVHALVFMSWIALFLTQTWLVASKNVALHRRLGWLSLLLIPLMVVVGLLVHRWSMLDHGGPPFIAANEFLFGNPMQLLVFAGLASAAIALRRDTGWHRRLLLCAFADICGAGVGRLVPLPLVIPYAWWVNVGLTLVFPLMGMLADKRRHGVVHPAWWWGTGTVVAVLIAGEMIAYSAWGLRFTEWYLAGSPGAERPMEAFPPSM
ncbi:hypothetical protein GRI99_16465 [Altererythrobacter buctensis]|uniref:DUF2306 domain-containing protein n=1 Tax=Alteraurantiacibacter buctensis TaxID=1503981 RepID=A0A844Z5Z2_9SPHN|nr:hypothetical protein [Alteraurantiacibacter buctensis]